MYIRGPLYYEKSSKHNQRKDWIILRDSSLRVVSCCGSCGRSAVGCAERCIRSSGSSDIQRPILILIPLQMIILHQRINTIILTTFTCGTKWVVSHSASQDRCSLQLLNRFHDPHNRSVKVVFRSPSIENDVGPLRSFRLKYNKQIIVRRGTESQIHFLVDGGQIN